MRRLIPWILTLLVWPTTSHTLPMDTQVLAVGNNTGALTEVGLLYAESDALSVAEALRRQGGVPSGNIQTLLNEKPDAIRAALDNAEQHAGSTLVVYYSGHADNRALHMGGQDLAIEELRARLDASSARVRVLIVDACRSGTVTRVKGVRRAPAFKLSLDDKLDAEGTAIITSSAAGESSQESDRLQGSIFSHHFVNGLRGAADQDGDGAITLNEAYAYAYDRTLASSGRTLNVQHPTYALSVKGRGGLVLTRVEMPHAGSGRLKLGPPADYLVTDGSGAVVAEVRPPKPNALLALAPRGYQVQRRDALEYREYKVRLEAGQTVALSEQPYESVRYDRLVRQRGGSAAHGLSVMAGERGELLTGEGSTHHLIVGYGLDLPWLSLGLRLRGARVQTTAEFERRRDEVGIAVTLQRVADLNWATASLGLTAEVSGYRQRFDTQRLVIEGEGVGAAFGGLLGLERRVADGLSVRLEGGPLTALFREGAAREDQAGGEQLSSPFTWWVASGLVWRL